MVNSQFEGLGMGGQVKPAQDQYTGWALLFKNIIILHYLIQLVGYSTKMHILNNSFKMRQKIMACLQ